MAINFSLRQDGANYLEGMTAGQYIELGLGQYSWLVPGVTYTKDVLSDSGVMYIPKITGTQGSATALCVDGDPGTSNVEYLSLIIDKKVTAQFDGCFTVAGIADQRVQRLLNNYKLKNMQNDFQDDILTYIETTATASAKKLDPDGTESPSDYLLSLKNEYFNTNEFYPTVALVSSAFYEALEKELKVLATPLGDATLVYGYAGVTNGLLIRPVPRMVDTHVVLYVPEALHIATPSSPKNIGDNILGSVDNIEDNFFNGYVSMADTNALAATSTTYLHKFYGKGIPVTAQVLKGVEV